MKKFLILVLLCFSISSCARIKADFKYPKCQEEKKIHFLLENNTNKIGIQMHKHQTYDVHYNLIKSISPGIIRQDWFSSQSLSDHDLFVSWAKEINAKIIFTVKSEDFDYWNLVFESRRYANDPVIWELENEPDKFLTPIEYYNWCKETVESIRYGNKNACIIGPALTGIGDDELVYFKQLFALEYDELIDAVSVHLYTETKEKDYEKLYVDLRRFQDFLCGTKKPIIFSEGGPKETKSLEENVLFLDRILKETSRINSIGFVWYAIEGNADVPLLINWERTPFSYEIENYIEKRK